MADKKSEPGIIQFPRKSSSSKPRMSFGKVLREYRLKANLEQEQLGKVCGVTGNSISNWECERSKPDVSLVPILCKALNMPLHAFFGMNDPNTYSKNEKALITDYRSLTTPNKKQLHKVMDAILESQREARRENYRSTRCGLRCVYRNLAAGFGVPIDEEPESHPLYVRMSREACKADYIFPVSGESMEPDFPDGSMVFVEKVDPDFISYGDIIACVVSGTPYIKIHQKDGLHSINPKYKVIHVGEDESVHLIGRVVGLVPPEDIPSEEENQEIISLLSESDE